MMETEAADNKEQILEGCASANTLNRVTPFSKYLAMALFILLPFVGGWIGYQYAPEQVVEVERVVEVAVDLREPVVGQSEKQREEVINDLTQSSEQLVLGWVTLPICNPKSNYNGTFESITIPINMGLAVSSNQGGDCFDLAYEFGPYIAESTNPTISSHLLTYDKDLRFISFVILSDAVEGQKIEIFVADTKKKKLHLVDDHVAPSIVFAEHNSVSEGQQYDRGGLITDEKDGYYFVYKWFGENETSITKVFSIDREELVYENECINVGGSFGPLRDPVVSSVREGKMVFTGCDSNLLVTDFSETLEIELPSYIIAPSVLGYTDSGKIQFYDREGFDDMLRSPVYSIDVTGTNLIKEADTIYGGF